MTDKELLGYACEQFLGKTVTEIKSVILQTLEGHLRSILGEWCWTLECLSELHYDALCSTQILKVYSNHTNLHNSYSTMTANIFPHCCWTCSERAITLKRDIKNTQEVMLHLTHSLIWDSCVLWSWMLCNRFIVNQMTP